MVTIPSFTCLPDGTGEATARRGWDGMDGVATRDQRPQTTDQAFFSSHLGSCPGIGPLDRWNVELRYNVVMIDYSINPSSISPFSAGSGMFVLHSLNSPPS